MVIATKLYVQHPDLPLTPTIRSYDEVELGVFSDAGTDPENEVHIFWIEAPDVNTVHEALAEDPTVEDFSVLIGSEQSFTCQVEYAEDTLLMTPAVVDSGGLTIEAGSHSDGWKLTLQLPDHDALFALDQYANENDMQLEILELHQSEGFEEEQEFGLTTAQREALVSAYVQGYYDKPRKVSLDKLASTLGISSTAVSGRLNRGSHRLIEETLIDDDD